jgi:hypothetical protein
VEAVAQALRSDTARLWASLQRTDRFFKMRAGIVGAWAVLSVATLWGACSSPGSSSSLGAEVELNRASIMGVQLMVRNDSHRNWEDVTLSVDDGWKYTDETIRGQDGRVLPMTAFRKGEEGLPRDHVPRSLTITCRQGSDRFDLH